MGRFKAEAIIIKELPDLKIIFYDRKTIYAYPKNRITNHRGVIFHRWYAPLGSYTGGWGAFRRRILRRRHLSLTEMFNMASSYQIEHICTDRELNLKGKNIKYED